MTYYQIRFVKIPRFTGFLDVSFSRNLRKRNPIAVGYKGHRHGLHLLHVILWLSPLLFFPGPRRKIYCQITEPYDTRTLAFVTRGRGGRRRNTKEKRKFRRLIWWANDSNSLLSSFFQIEWIDIWTELFVNRFNANY